MKKIFSALLCLMTIGSFAQTGANPVSVKTVKHCIDEYALNNFKDLKKDSLYGSDRNNGHQNYWCRYKLLFQLGSDSSFVLYRSAFREYSLEFFYGYDTEAEGRILKVVDEVVDYYIKKYKWTIDEDVDNPDNEIILLDKDEIRRMQFKRNSATSTSVLEIFGLRL